MALLVEAIDTGIDEGYAESINILPGDPLDALRALAWRIFDGDHLLRVRLSIHIFDHASIEPKLQERVDHWIAQAFAPLLEAMETFQRSRDLPLEDARMKAFVLDAIASSAGMRSAFARESDAARRRTFSETWDAFLSTLYCARLNVEIAPDA